MCTLTRTGWVMQTWHALAGEACTDVCMQACSDASKWSNPVIVGTVKQCVPAFMHETLSALMSSTASNRQCDRRTPCSQHTSAFISLLALLCDTTCVPSLHSSPSPPSIPLPCVSFGVVMLELLTGRNNIIDNEVKPVHIKEWVSHVPSSIPQQPLWP